jgi:fatty-acid desaturase
VYLFIAACLAHQGDPYQWAVMHGYHHCFCDTDQDPHSPTVMGIIPAAIAVTTYRAQSLRPLKPIRFFQLMTTFELYILRTCVYIIQTMEILLVWYIFGIYTAGVVITSSFFSTLPVCAFNILFHFSPCVAQCKADSALTMLYPPFSYLFRSVAFLFGEDDHEDHHRHPRRLIRSECDLIYFILIKPLMYFQCVTCHRNLTHVRNDSLTQTI